MDKEICSNCLLKKENHDCRFAFCNIYFLKRNLFELVADPNHNVNSISEELNIDRKTLFRFADKNFKLNPKGLIDVLRILLFIELYDEGKEINYLINKSGFNNSRNFWNILKQNYGIDKKSFLKLLKNAKMGQEKENQLKRKLLYKNE